MHGQLVSELVLLLVIANGASFALKQVLGIIQISIVIRFRIETRLTVIASQDNVPGNTR
ncbi:MAG: hypothetical protein OEU51_00265 [Gammaproteobacteria bacterium]|jgi:hypothetical protein|nr:hypothetical protein [Gammaproteobacteria bacterium]